LLNALIDEVGNKMLCFRCQSDIDGELKRFRMKS
jgi:hypothetical protein